MNIEDQLMRYSQASGYLQGILIAMALYEDITPSKFKHIYEALNRSIELAGHTMMDFDRERLHKRAKELGVVI